MEEDDAPLDENGEAIELDKEGELPQATLAALKATKVEQYERCRGDNKFEEGVTNQFLIDMIEQLEMIEKGERLPGESEKKQVEVNVEKASGSGNTEEKPPEKSDRAETYNEAKRYLEEYIVDVIEFETPFRHCFYFKNEIWLR